MYHSCVCVFRLLHVSWHCCSPVKAVRGNMGQTSNQDMPSQVCKTVNSTSYRRTLSSPGVRQSYRRCSRSSSSSSRGKAKQNKAKHKKKHSSSRRVTYLVEVQEPLRDGNRSGEVQPVLAGVNSRRRFSWGEHDPLLPARHRGVPGAGAVRVHVEGGTRAGGAGDEPAVVRATLFAQHGK